MFLIAASLLPLYRPRAYSLPMGEVASDLLTLVYTSTSVNRDECQWQVVRLHWQLHFQALRDGREPSGCSFERYEETVEFSHVNRVLSKSLKNALLVAPILD